MFVLHVTVILNIDELQLKKKKVSALDIFDHFLNVDLWGKKNLSVHENDWRREREREVSAVFDRTKFIRAGVHQECLE